MTRFIRTLTCSAVGIALLVPSSAQASRFRDSVYNAQEQAHSSGLTAWRFNAPDGHSIRLRLSESIDKTAASVGRAESYALLLEGQLHSFEMSSLTITVVRADEMGEWCGEGALACYGGDEMIVSYDELGGVPVGEVVTHEYGHHLAAHRRNSLGPAIDLGPQTWASSESVCYRSDAGKLFPGDEGEHYWENPGEGFAEAYARFHHGNDTWDYSRLLRPDDEAFESIAFDAAHQLSKTPSTAVFRGNLGRGRRTQTYSLTLPQDTRLDVALYGPSGANYDLRLKNPGYYDETTKRWDARDRLNTAACFAQGVAKTVKIRVTRKSGSGPFELRVKYWDRYDSLG